MKYCPHCGEELPNESFTFCPYCGKNVTIPPAQDAADKAAAAAAGTIPPYAAAQVNAQQQAPAEPQMQAPAEPQMQTPVDPQVQAMGTSAAPKAGKKKKPIIPIVIIGCLLVLAGAGYMIYQKITTPRPLTFNSGDPIEVYVGDEGTIPIYGEGLENADYQTAVWSSGNSDVLPVDKGQYTAYYDSGLFYEDSWEGADPASYTTSVSVTIEKGLRTWTGTADVKIILPQQEIPGGTVLKKPADANGSTLTIIPSNNYSSYIYLKSKTKESNDMALVVKKGEKAEFDLPADQYEMYIANGYNWYGEENLFGPNTQYNKEDGDFDFYTYTYTLTLDITGGNLNEENLDEEDFPDL